MKLIYEIRLSSNTKKFIKKLKDQKLKQLIIDRIYLEIANEPYKWGIEKQGDLAGIWVSGLRYNKVEYRIAYMIEDNLLIPILLTDTHEGFYKQLKRLIN